MIPIHLSLSGFLSYCDPVELDFTHFDLACIAGSNGAGKSSLLDAITWALFGQARKRDDSLINTRCDSAEVRLVFSYEGNLFRVQRSKARDKTGMLEFHIAHSASGEAASWESIQQGEAGWRALSERSMRETEERIRETLRMDYDTFINASFFLQGKADQFTQQRPSDRKRILGSILGLDAWEVYRERAAGRRRLVEEELAGLDGRLQEIQAELVEETARKQRLAELEGELERIQRERQGQESLLENIRRINATLVEQARLVEMLGEQSAGAAQRLADLRLRLDSRQQESQSYAALLGRAEAILAAYAGWETQRQELARLEQVAARFREHEKRREAPRLEIQAEQSRLETERLALQAQQAQADTWREEIARLDQQIQVQTQAVEAAELQLTRRSLLESELQEARQRQVEARAENPRLKEQMDELKERIDRLEQTEGATCPLCGQPLSESDRQALVATLRIQGKDLGDRYRANQGLVVQLNELVRECEANSAQLMLVEPELRRAAQLLAGLKSRLEFQSGQLAGWEQHGPALIQEIEAALLAESYAPEARQRLTKIDAELKEIGYDAAAHDAARQAELEGRAIEAELRSLEKAQAALAPLGREITELETQVKGQAGEAERLAGEHVRAQTALGQAREQAPDQAGAESLFYQLQEKENGLRMAVGAAQQKVLVLDDLRQRRQALDAQRSELARRIGQYRQLERAFGKDGVPALLIEQALPEIETRANDVLDRLSGGNMTVRFVTQAAYKDKKRDDLKETLDIQISDGAGPRDYEMFSGGEAFRVNFAIRLALSEVLAQRAGARLQTLVIDEGFGSQDAQGRQRLIEAINLVRSDFAKILVITHIDELKDAFPTRIEVEKTERGSTVRVI